jgi:predicted Zn-dependent protease with MMP-like domain
MPRSSADVEVTLDLAEQALDEGDAAHALALCEQILALDANNVDATFLSAECVRSLGALDEAELRYRKVLRLEPTHAAGWCGLASTLFDQLKFDEARNAITRAIRADSLLPDAYHWRGLLRERRGDEDGAQRDFHRAHRLDPEGFPRPVTLDDATVEAVVSEAIATLHPSIREYLTEVAIVLEDVPDEDVCRAFDPPMPPAEILGFFSGSSLAERSSGNAWSSVPPTIVLFRRNLERVASDHERMVEELRVTVFHEIGHFLGLDEDDLEERAL